MWFIILSLVLTVPNALSEFRFDNYALYKIILKDVDQVNFLKTLRDSDARFDFWNDPVAPSSYVNVLTNPKDRNEFENILKSKDVEFEISTENIQDAIDREVIKTYTRGNIKSMTWDGYYNLSSINDWIDDLAATYPKVVEVITGGTTYEDRAIKGLKISHGEGRRAIFLEGGIHSREWISPATVTYITNELLTNDNEDIKAAAHGFDWYIFPVTNPDGYIWSFENARMWRKNRRPIGDHIGVDLNRNWDNNWMVVGASSNPARDDYAGTAPFSEPETKSLSEFLTSIGDNIDMYLSFHSYGQMLLIPFGNTTAPLANYHDARNIGARGMGALSAKYGTLYRTGNIAETIYHASGGSIDWVKEELKVPLVYCYELRDNGAYGFVLPNEQILPNNLEVMDSLLELIFQAKRFGYLQSSGYGINASLVLIMTALLAIFMRD